MIFSNIVCRTSLPLSASQTRTYSMASSVFSVTTDHFTWHDPAFRRGPSRALDQLIASNRFPTSPKVKAYLGHSAIHVGPQLQPHGRNFTLSMPETESGTGWSPVGPRKNHDQHHRNNCYGEMPPIAGDISNQTPTHASSGVAAATPIGSPSSATIAAACNDSDTAPSWRARLAMSRG